MKHDSQPLFWLPWSFPRCWPFPAVQNQAASSLGNPSRSLSPIESEALAAALNTWAGQLYFRQGNTFSHLFTTVKDIAPPAVIRELSDGNAITINWEECGTQQGTKGEAQMKNFKSWISSSVLSAEDKKNGITWKGQAEFIYSMRYRAVGGMTSFLIRITFRPRPIMNRFSPWADVGNGISGNFIGSPTTVSIVKQNGKWTSVVSSAPEFPAIGTTIKTLSQFYPHYPMRTRKVMELKHI